MPALAPSRVTPEHSGRPFVVALLLTLGVWASALISLGWVAPTPRSFHLTTGSATDLAGAIRSAPRAIVFVDEPTSTYSAATRVRFLEDARRLARDHGALGVRFFVVERQYTPETRVWLDGLRDERLDLLGRRMRGSGGLIWVESGRVVEADDSVGGPGTDPNLVGRRAVMTRARCRFRCAGDQLLYTCSSLLFRIGGER